MEFVEVALFRAQFLDHCDALVKREVDKGQPSGYAEKHEIAALETWGQRGDRRLPNEKRVTDFGLQPLEIPGGPSRTRT